MLKRMMSVAIGTMLLSAATAQVTAQEDDGRSQQTVITSRTFTIAKGRCSQLPPNLEIQGIGLERTTTVVRDDGRRLSYSRISTITGSASDNLGGTYTFVYHNRLNARSIPGMGVDVDTFALRGSGMADGMSTFFRANVTLDSGANPVGFAILEATGDPFTCDPL